MLEEAYREVLYDAFDLKNAQLIIDDIKNGNRKIDYRTYSPVPSPLSHSLILSGLSDIVLMEDRSALLRELHTQVLGRVLEQGDGEKPRFEKELIEGYFNEKKPIIGSREGIIQAIKQIGGIYLLNDRVKSSYRMSDMASTEMQDLCHDLINEGLVESVWTEDKDDLFVIPKLVPYYQAIYCSDDKLSKNAKKAYDGLKGTKEIKSKKVSQELEKKYLVSKTTEGLRKRKNRKDRFI